MISAVLLLSGQSERAGIDTPKQFYAINGKELFEYSLKTLLEAHIFDSLILVTQKKYFEHVSSIMKTHFFGVKFVLVEGGNTRQESVFNALNYLSTKGIDEVLIHDAARPFISKNAIKNVIKALKEANGTSLYSKVSDSICTFSEDNYIKNYQNRDEIVKIETPQAFKFDIIFKAHLENIKSKDFMVTDDASLLLKVGEKVKLVENSDFNLKVTTRSDLLLAEKILKTL